MDRRQRAQLDLTFTIAAAAAIALSGIALSATALQAALPTNTDVSGRTSLAGQLLIATPALRDSPFERTVILMAQHNREGALGIVINKPLEERTVASLLAAFGEDAEGSGNARIRIFLGGPVGPAVGLVIHSSAYRIAHTLDIDGKVALTGAPEVLRDIGAGKGPGKSLVAFGYAGWAPSQLDGEIARGDWYTVSEDPALVFDEDRAKVWDAAMLRYRASR
jgi:putative transcriptional regulator